MTDLDLNYGAVFINWNTEEISIDVQYAARHRLSVTFILVEIQIQIDSHKNG